MRGWMARALLCASIVFVFANQGFAAGPQFTGLMSTYSQDHFPYVDKNANYLARMDPDGPIPGTVIPVARSWSDMVVAPNGSAWYGTTHHEVFKINPTTGAATELIISASGITDPSWITGETWDSTRNRLVVATLGGVGYMFGYFDTSNQWNLISSLNNVDLRAIVHRPANDTIYALENPINHEMPLTRLLKYNASGQPTGTVPLSQGLPFEPNSTDLDWQLLLASDGQLAVLAPARFPTGTGPAGTMLYLINPDSGVVTYSGQVPVPEPGMMGIVIAAGALLARRVRRR